MKDSVCYRTRGGMVSIAALRNLAETTVAQGDARVYATCRQQFVLKGVPVPRALGMLGEPASAYAASTASNAGLLSTAPAAGMPGTLDWLSSGLYAELLQQLEGSAPVALGLCDPFQPYLPVRMGALGLLASEERDLWYLQLNHAPGGLACGRQGAFRSGDLAAVAQAAHRCLSGGQHLAPEVLERTLAETLEHFRVRTARNTAACATLSRYQQPQDVIAIPVNAHGLSGGFLIALCVLAGRETGASFSLTPWRTLWIRGLSDGATAAMRALMLRHRVHELSASWRACFLGDCEDQGSADALSEALDKHCNTRAGLAVCITSQHAPLFDAHVLIREKVTGFGPFRRMHYEIFRRSHASPAPAQWELVSTTHLRAQLAESVVQAVCSDHPEEEVASHTPPAPETTAYLCSQCFTEYAERYGDPAQGIRPDTPFAELPEAWECPVCSGSKSQFQPAGEKLEL